MTGSSTLSQRINILICSNTGQRQLTVIPSNRKVIVWFFLSRKCLLCEEFSLVIGSLQLRPWALASVYLDLIQMTGIRFWLKRSWRDRNPSWWIVAPRALVKASQTASQTIYHVFSFACFMKTSGMWVGGGGWGRVWLYRAPSHLLCSTWEQVTWEGQRTDCLDDGWPSSRKLLLGNCGQYICLVAFLRST